MEWKPNSTNRVKWATPRMYTFDDKTKYKSYNIPCKYQYTTEQIEAILRKVKTFLATYVYIPCAISDWYLVKLQGVLEHKKLYRFETKKNLEEIKALVRRTIFWFEDDFCNAEYFNELSLSYIETMTPYLDKFQKFIEVKLANLGYKNVSVSALSYISYQFLCEGYVNYGMAMKGAKQDFDFDFTELFSYLRPELACDKSNKFMLSTGLTEEFVEKFNEKKEIIEMFTEIEKMFSDAKLQKKASKAALEVVDDEMKAKMKSGSNEIENTLKEIRTNNLKKKQNENSKTVRQEQQGQV